jgi:hypothetical protein
MCYHRSRAALLLVVLAQFVLPTWASLAANADGSADSTIVSPSIEDLGEGRYRIGTLQLDRNSRSISVKGRVNMDKGLVEVLACTAWGKVHESILVLDVEPYHLQVALLLLGLQPHGAIGGGSDRLDTLPKSTADSLSKRVDETGGAFRDSQVQIWAEWEEQPGQRRRVRAEEMVWNHVDRRPMRATDWVFTGSQVMSGVFMAQVEGSLIATYNDPNAILDNPLDTGADDTIYFANEHLVPPKETSVTVIIVANR